MYTKAATSIKYSVPPEYTYIHGVGRCVCSLVYQYFMCQLLWLCPRWVADLVPIESGHPLHITRTATIMGNILKSLAVAILVLFYDDAKKSIERAASATLGCTRNCASLLVLVVAVKV